MSRTSRYPQRRRIRLASHNYTGPKSYFVTLRVLDGECLFGDVVNGEMQLNAIGNIVDEEWLRTPVVRPYVKLDAHVVMPNHMHGILDILDTNPHHQDEGGEPLKRSGVVAGSLGAIIGQFKSQVAKRIKAMGYVRKGPLWLRSYNDHIIRTESEKVNIRRYIWDNPVRWEQKRRMRRT